MSSNALIDAQFDRAVEIIQGLPKTGPIQTDYEAKLTMYSLYKQATIGNVKSPRPGIWDMLGRAKWDAWAKHKDVTSYEAKWLYVDALIKVLRKYSDKTVARNLVQELEAYGGDPFNLVMSGTMSRGSDSSGSSASDEEEEDDVHHSNPYLHPVQPGHQQADSGTEDDSGEDEARELPTVHHDTDLLLPNRTGSSLSSHRYRTPMTGSLAMSPPLAAAAQTVPITQPLPGFETPSAFGESATPAQSSRYPGSQFSQSSRGELASSPPAPLYPLHHQFRAPSQPQFGPYIPVRPATRPTIERAVENVQSQIAALSERLEMLESIYLPETRSHSSLAHSGSNGRRRPDSPEWDFDDLGMWSLVLNPIQSGLRQLRALSNFLVKNESRTPSAIILRRLFLDVSFLFCCLFLMRAMWRKSGARRKDVRAALVVLWRAILGTKDRSMVDKGI